MQPNSTALAQPSVSPECEMLEEVKRLVGLPTFNHWFRKAATIEIVHDEVTIGIDNPFLLSWMQHRFGTAVGEAARRVLGDSARIRFKAPPAAGPKADPAAGPKADPPEAKIAQNAAQPTFRVLDAPREDDRRAESDARPVGDKVGRPGGIARKLHSRPPALRSPPALRNTQTQGTPPASRSAPHEAPQKVQSPASGSGPRADDRTPHSASSGLNRAVLNRSGLNGPGPIGAGPAPAGPARPAGRRFADLCDFVKGPGNELALTAALQICEQPGTRYNPLVLFGGVGTGKTHLLEATYRRLRAGHPSLHVLFLSAEGFANHFTQALRDRSLPSFRQRFRAVDVLVVDDVDFLDGKRVIQEEFLHTIRQLESHERQIALSADRHPRLLTRLSEELVTRFISGIVCRMESPDLETRRTIVARKAARLSAGVSDEVLELVAQRFRSSVRELEGALNCLETYGLMTGKPVGLSAARHLLSDLERDCVRIVRLADVEQTVCRFFAVGPDELRSPRRSRSISQPRMLAMYLARKMTQAAYSEIGEYFGGRNHSTVVSAEKRVRNLLASQVSFRVAAQSWKVGDLLSSLEQQLLTG